MKVISTDDALSASGHYSQAIVHGDLIYVSGQLPFDFRTGQPIHGTAGEQADAALTNLRRVLEAGGTRLEQVIRCTVYVSDIGDWDEVNDVYSKHFGDHKPARAIVPTGPLHFDFKIEIEAIAVVDQK